MQEPAHILTCSGNRATKRIDERAAAMVAFSVGFFIYSVMYSISVTINTKEKIKIKESKEGYTKKGYIYIFFKTNEIIYLFIYAVYHKTSNDGRKVF